MLVKSVNRSYTLWVHPFPRKYFYLGYCLECKKFKQQCFSNFTLQNPLVVIFYYNNNRQMNVIKTIVLQTRNVLYNHNRLNILEQKRHSNKRSGFFGGNIGQKTCLSLLPCNYIRKPQYSSRSTIIYKNNLTFYILLLILLSTSHHLQESQRSTKVRPLYSSLWKHQTTVGGSSLWDYFGVKTWQGVPEGLRVGPPMAG